MKDVISEAIKSSKDVLRKEMKIILNNMSQEEIKRQSMIVFNKLTSMPQYESSKRVSIYLSMDNEIDTLPILKDLFAKRKQIFIPKYQGKTMEMVKLESIEDYHQLPRTKWNIKQPANNDVRENALNSGGLDLICLPGLAFSKCGKRLGHGMGYYDKYLKICMSSQRHKPYLVALAFKEQLLDDLPTQSHDIQLDNVLYEKNS